MGCYADIYAGERRILTYKNVLPDFLTDIFNDCDKIHEFGKKASRIAKQYGLEDLANWLGEYDDNEMIIFVQKASVIKKRLAIYGYSDDLYKSQITESLDENEEFLKQLIIENKKDLGYSRALKQDLTKLREFRSNGDENVDLIGRIRQTDFLNGDEILNYIPDDIIFYGCVCSLKDDDYIVLDYSDLNSGGYMDISEFSSKDDNPIIIAEGVNDFKVLDCSLGIIYPELVDNITFLDIEGYKVEGGAGAAVKMIKSFAGAGIKNRILALLDNDTGALSALRSVKNKPFKLPANLKIVQYPNIKICEKYPTVGPQGEVVMDVNGLAGSIEMYLGKEVLTNDGELEKIMWTSYMDDVQKYQGELINKKDVNKRFDEIIKKVTKDNYEYDFSDLKTLWDYVISQLAHVG